MPSRKPSRKNAQSRTSAQNPEPKPPSTSAKPQSPRKPGRRRMKRNRRGSGSSHSLNLTEAKSSKSKSLGDQVNRNPGACIGEKLPDDAVDREASPNTSTSGSHHSNQEEASQHCDSQARKARPGELGKENQFNSKHR